jgi:hypothetical protein
VPDETNHKEIAMTLNVVFKSQGGKAKNGLAVGRQGQSQFLIQYLIEDGSPRERWIPANRILEVRGSASLSDLPRFKRVQCAGGTPSSGEAGYHNCPNCPVRTWLREGEIWPAHTAIVPA